MHPDLVLPQARLLRLDAMPFCLPLTAHMHGLIELGLSVPDDVSVTGFDDILQSAWPSHELTTLRQPIRRMAETSVRMLMDQIGGISHAGERRLLPAELKVRGSTRRPV